MKTFVLLFLVMVLGSLAKEDLGGKVFVFPTEISTDHVILKPTITKPLRKVSVCLNSYSHLQRPYSLFSLSTPSSANAFSFFSNSPTYYNVILDNEFTTYRTDSESMDWRHICVTWDSNTGVVQLWVNGKLSPRRVHRKGFSIEANTSIVLGQEQVSFGGKFDSYKPFLGELSDVHMWDYVLTPGDIHKVISGGLNGNVINWRSLGYEMKGSVLIQPKLQCKSWGSTSSLYTPCY